MTIEITTKQAELLNYCLNYTKSNLEDEAFCLGGIDVASEEELQQAEKDIDELLLKINTQ